MYIDAELKLSDTLAQTNVGDNLTTNVVDGAVLNRNIGIGEPMSLYFGIKVDAIVNDADETYEFQIQESTDEAFTTPIITTKRIFTNAQAILELLAGDKVVLGFPTQPVASRFYRGNIVMAGTTPGLTTSTFIQPTNMIQNEFREGYASGFEVA